MLHDAKRYKPVRPPKELPPEVMLRHAQEYFQEWMESADHFMRGAEFQLSGGGLKIAAFDLHQSAERHITSLLLVHTGYRAKEYDMEKLIQQAVGFGHPFAGYFPQRRQTGAQPSMVRQSRTLRSVQLQFLGSR
ncbi:MAG: HEPN domain-containing protein [Candidatus Thiodiazotropha sp. (ex Epidulcina cf. delphinae)]|nr:HEPN domain-containing protein [Candidatus Thiodiazotropha sp. (ex Epidulcina cf. delphinae)]